MEKALPAMINLEHLYVNPHYDSLPANDGWVSSQRLLKSFKFQLKSLTWRNYFHPNNGVPEFLRTQHELAHLEVGRYPFSLRLGWLDNGLCPNVVSGTGGLDSLAHASRSRQIVAWKEKWTKCLRHGKASYRGLGLGLLLIMDPSMRGGLRVG